MSFTIDICRFVPRNYGLFKFFLPENSNEFIKHIYLIYSLRRYAV